MKDVMSAARTSGSSDAGAAVPARSVLGEVAVEAVVLSELATAAQVDEVFRAEERLTSVVLLGPVGRVRLISRPVFEFKMAGRLGHGRNLWSRRPAAQMSTWDATVLPADLALSVAAQEVLQRTETGRYDDVVVRAPDNTLGVVQVSVLFEHLSALFAHHAMHDPLTGLPNRLFLATKASELSESGASSTVTLSLDRALTRAGDEPEDARTRFPEPAPARNGACEKAPGLLYIDLDDFKAVNDRHGHLTGDQLLRQVALRLRKVVRPEDVVVRLGGDEFAVLLVTPLTAETASAIADRIVRTTAEPFLINDQVVTIGASVGVTRLGDFEEHERHQEAVEILLHCADAAMYRAKSSGRGQVVHYLAPPALAAAPARPLSLSDRLRTALTEGRLRLHYQPIIEVVSGRVVGLEALSRWHEPDLGDVRPDEFIAAAEASGLIHDLGRWALTEGCAQAARWARDRPGDPLLPVSVNVSAMQLNDPNFTDDVTRALAAAGATPLQLKLEITETAAVTDLHATIQQLTSLKQLGVSLALDDFGTGFSSLTLLRRLPIDIVKIDKSFVDRLDGDATDAVLVRLIIEAAHGLGMTVCAEGVERPEQLQALHALGCDTVQGFLLAAPTSASKINLRDRDLPTIVAGFNMSGTGAGPFPIAHDLVIVHDAEGLISYVSAASVTVLGQQPADLIGSHLELHFQPEALPTPSDSRWHSKPSDDLTASQDHIVYRARHRDGSKRWLRTSTRALDGADTGRLPQLLTTARDVTARVLAEQQMHSAHVLLQAAFDHSPIGMAIVTRQGQPLRVNQALCRLLRRSSSEILASTRRELTHLDDHAADDSLLNALDDGPEHSSTAHKRFLLPDGSYLPVTITVIPIDQAGQDLLVHVQVAGS